MPVLPAKCGRPPDAMADIEPESPDAADTADERDEANGSGLRWSMTLQALAGAGALSLLLLATGWLLLHTLELGSGPTWPESAEWLALRMLLALVASLLLIRMVRWFWVPLPAPAGICLARDEVPELHALVDDLRRRFGIRSRLEVCITGDMNAAIAPRRHGLTLLVGLPLLLSVTPRQCDAILSHELGHLVLQRAGPGRWASWLRAWWFRVLDRIDQDASPLGRLAGRLLSAADRRYLADGLSLARAEEFEADALAARAIGAGPLAEALSAMALKEHFLAQDFLPKVRAQVYHRQQPSMLPYRHMASAFQVGYDSRRAMAALGDLVGEEAPTHPSIQSRMDRLMVESWPQPGDTASAAEAYLGTAVPRLAAVLDQEWWSHHGRDWQRHHREVQWARRRIARIAERGRDQHPLRRLELASLVEGYWPELNPAEFYLDLLAEEEVRPQAMLALGRLLTEQGSIEGAGYLLALLDQNSEVGLTAALLLLEFAEASGREDLARRALPRAADLEALGRQVETEAAEDPEGEGWTGPGLDPITKYRLTKRVAAHGDVRRAYLVRRRSRVAPDWLGYLLLLRTDNPDPEHLADIVRQAREPLSPQALLGVVALPADSPRELAAMAAGRTRLHLRRRLPRQETGEGRL